MDCMECHVADLAAETASCKESGRVGGGVRIFCTQNCWWLRQALSMTGCSEEHPRASQLRVGETASFTQ